MDDIKLPPLPEPFMDLHREERPLSYIKGWSDQMQAYARQAVLDERDAGGWRACAGCPAPNDCQRHGCGEARGLWKIKSVAIRGPVADK